MFNSKLKNLTIVIVTYKSRSIILKNLSHIKSVKNILILDNSNDLDLKLIINKKYKHIKFFTSKKNLGYAAGNNFLLKKVTTDFVLILNPDCLVKINEIFKAFNLINLLKNNCAILGSSKEAKIIKRDRINKKNFYYCEYVKGFFMMCNLKKIKKLNFFDENFFLYLEEIDLCKRAIENNFKIIASDHIKIKHLGAKSSGDRGEFNRLQNWHWMWSKFYFSNKHYGNFFSYIIFLPQLILSFIKKIIFRNQIKYTVRNSGLFNSMIKKKSFYRLK